MVYVVFILVVGFGMTDFAAADCMQDNFGHVTCGAGTCMKDYNGHVVCEEPMRSTGQ